VQVAATRTALVIVATLWSGRVGIAQKQQIQVNFDPRIELISILETLTDREFRGLMTTDDTAYRRDVMAWFSVYKAHPAVQRLKESAARGYDHDAPMAAAVCLSAPPELSLEASPEDCGAARTGGPTVCSRGSASLGILLENGIFMAFIRAHAGLYSMIEESTRSKIPGTMRPT
jgi:hypothetical protein